MRHDTMALLKISVCITIGTLCTVTTISVNIIIVQYDGYLRSNRDRMVSINIAAKKIL